MRLLIVEDNERFAEFVKIGLASSEFTVDAVATATNGNAAFLTVNFDAIILDLGLPDADCLTLLKTRRDQGDNTPVLILTSRDGVD